VDNRQKSKKIPHIIPQKEEPLPDWILNNIFAISDVIILPVQNQEDHHSAGFVEKW
jgi:hypothetical protein